MAKITWNTEVNAPCVGKILGPKTRSNSARTGRFIWREQSLLNSNWDYPSVAQTFGWSLIEVQVQNTGYYGLAPCDHLGTDGTVDCPRCGIKAGTFISAAYDWLANNDGAEADDPGHFS